MRVNLPFVPTQRAAWIAVSAAPVALIIAATAPQAWIIAPIGVLALLMLVMLDATLAGRVDDWEVSAPGDGEVGEAVPITVTATMAKPAKTANILE